MISRIQFELDLRRFRERMLPVARCRGDFFRDVAGLRATQVAPHIHEEMVIVSGAADVLEWAYKRSQVYPRMKGLDNQQIADHTAEIIENLAWMKANPFYDGYENPRQRGDG